MNASTKPQNKQEVKKVEPKKAHVFTSNDLDLKSKHILEFHVFLPDGLSIEDIKPSSWAHIAHRLQPMAHIYVTSESNQFSACLQVMSCSKLDAITEVLWYKKFSSGDRAATSQFSVEWINQKDKFGVLRSSDNVYVAKGITSEAEANQRLVNEMTRTA